MANNGSENSKLIIMSSVSNGVLDTSSTTQVGGVLGYTGTNVEISCDKVYANAKCVIADVMVLSNASISGGNAHLNTQLDLVTNANTDGVWIATSEGPELRKFSTKEAVTEAVGTAISKEWYESKAGSETAITYEIRTVADFYGFAEIVNKGVDNFASDTIKLAADINLNPNWTMTVDSTGALTGETTALNRWTPIGTSSSKFAGIFDGQKHTIRGVCVEQAKNGVGLFGFADTTAQIKNLILDNSYIKNNNAQTGAVVGYFYGTNIENVKVTNKVVVNGNGGVVGGITGIVGAGNDKVVRTVQGCWVECKVYTAGQILAGILGRLWGGDITISNCLVTGEFINTGAHTGNYKGSRVGSFVGANDNSGDNDLRIEDCLSLAKFTVKNKGLVGSLVGRILDSRAGDNVAVNVYADVSINSDYQYNSLVSGSSSLDGITFDSANFASKDASQVVPNLFGTGKSGWSKVSGSYPIPAYWQ